MWVQNCLLCVSLRIVESLVVSPKGHSLVELDKYGTTSLISECPAGDCDQLTGYAQKCNGVSGWDSSINNAEPFGCTMLVNTNYGTCGEYCTGQGTTCLQGQDNVGSSCTLDANHGRQTTANNGCDQKWNNQVCVCACAPTPAPTPHPTPAPTPAHEIDHASGELFKFQNKESGLYLVGGRHGASCNVRAKSYDVAHCPLDDPSDEGFLWSLGDDGRITNKKTGQSLYEQGASRKVRLADYVAGDAGFKWRVLENKKIKNVGSNKFLCGGSWGENTRDTTVAVLDEGDNKEYGGNVGFEWEPTRESAPTPAPSISYVGLGQCRDDHGRFYDGYYSSGDTTEAACQALLQSLSHVPGVRAAQLKYTEGWTCHIRVDDGTNPTNVPIDAGWSGGNWQKGTAVGAVVDTDGDQSWKCWRINP